MKHRAIDMKSRPSLYIAPKQASANQVPKILKWGDRVAEAYVQVLKGLKASVHVSSMFLDTRHLLFQLLALR